MKSGSACVCVREHGLYGTGILFKECIGRVSVISCWHDHIPGQGNPRVDHDALALPSQKKKTFMQKSPGAPPLPHPCPALARQYQRR